MLCLVTDRLRCVGRPLEEVVDLAVLGGVDIVQLRERDMAAGPLLELAHKLRDITASRASLLVNDRIDVALACGAEGVQLTENSIPVEVARDLVGGDLLIGRSVHSVRSAIDASCAGADLVVFGTIFATGSHPGQTPSGVGPLGELSRHDTVPVLGIGGITPGNVGEVVAAGASGAAVITSITGSPDPERAARTLKQAIVNGWQRACPEEGVLA